MYLNLNIKIKIRLCEHMLLSNKWKGIIILTFMNNFQRKNEK